MEWIGRSNEWNGWALSFVNYGVIWVSNSIAEWNGWAIPFVTYGVIWVSNSISEWNGWADPMSGMGGLFDLQVTKWNGLAILLRSEMDVPIQTLKM